MAEGASYDGTLANAAVHRPKRVMIIEDEHLMADLYKKILAEYGHSIVVVAEGVADAIQKFERRQSVNDGEWKAGGCDSG
jgi:hypothetical protein